jgi:membrane protein implicated in regulation of membrane protease activity
MDALFALLGDVQPWHWLALGAILVGIEIISPTFYFLWPGLAAGVVGAALYLFPTLSPQNQVILFAVLSVVTTIGWKRFAPADWTTTKPHPTLNQPRAAQYVGRRARAADGFSGGRGAVLIDDTRWSAATDDGSDPAAGEMVTVTGSDGSVLKIARKAD